MQSCISASLAEVVFQPISPSLRLGGIPVSKLLSSEKWRNLG